MALGYSTTKHHFSLLALPRSLRAGLNLPWINELSWMCGLCSTAVSQLCQGCQLGLGAAQSHFYLVGPPCAQTGHLPGLGKLWDWERLQRFTWMQAALGKQSNKCCLLWGF